MNTPHKIIILFTLFAAFFSISVQSVNLKKSNLPIVVINTNGTKIMDEPKITANMKIYWTPDEINSITDATTDYDGFIGIELRGNSSQNWPKKPYKLETRDAFGDNLNISLMGLPKENDWVLHAPYVDKTLLRNALVYRVLNEMGWYAPRYRYCELVINGDYKGVYLLVESLKVDDHRIDLTKASSTNLTGGYLLELTTENRLSDDEPFLTTDIAEQVMAIKYPKDEELTKAHVNYITDYVNDFEKALHNKRYSGEQDYKNYIDVESFIDHMLVAEVFRQLDVFCASHHFYKDSAGLLGMGPGWDYNRSIGNYKGHDTWKTTGLWLTSPRGGCKPFWSQSIYDDANFMTPYKERYAELRDNILSTGHIYAIIDEYSTYLVEAKDRNFKVWDIEDNTSHKYVQGSYDGEINYVKDWLKDRFAWLDDQWAVDHHPVINEFYANGDGNSTEWVEFYNPSGVTINVSGWKLSLNGQTFTFSSNVTIPPNGYLVLTSNKTKFTAQYSGVSNVYGGLKGELLKDSVTISLKNNSAILMDEIKTSISSGWPAISKSGNYAVAMRPIAFDNAVGTHWNWSEATGGSPGAVNAVFDYSGLLISEIMSDNTEAFADEDGEYDDWIELTNTTNYTINVNGLFLSDEVHNYDRWQITDPDKLENTLLAPGKSILIWLDDHNGKQGNLHANFNVFSEGERIILSYFDGYVNQLIDQVNPPAMMPNQSYQLMDVETNEWLVSIDDTPGGYGDEYSGIDELSPSSLAQLKVYPNPVVSEFSIDFHIRQSQFVSVSLIDYSGRTLMSVISHEFFNEGHYTYTYALPEYLPAGLYVLHVSGDGYAENRKVLVVR